MLKEEYTKIVNSVSKPFGGSKGTNSIALAALFGTAVTIASVFAGGSAALALGVIGGVYEFR